MSLANWLLAAVGIWGLALTGAWVMYAQNSTTNGVLHQNRPQMMRDFGSWDMKDFKGPQMQLETITANLSDSDKNAVETLLNQYREEEKAFHVHSSFSLNVFLLITVHLLPSSAGRWCRCWAAYWWRGWHRCWYPLHRRNRRPRQAS